jgi:hypothetical protein
VQQLHLPAVVADQRREAPADAEVDAHLAVMRIRAVHVVPLLVGDHLQSQLVVVSQEQRHWLFAGICGVCARMSRIGKPVLHVNRHEHPGHDRKVEVHVALVAVAEIRGRVLGPLVRFREQHAIRKTRVDVRAQFLQELVRRGEVFAVRPSSSYR